VLSAIAIFGGESIRYFSIALLVGIFFGTYSSIFVASALLVTSYKLKLKN
jgi:preprotein translocase subunit SecF